MIVGTDRWDEFPSRFGYRLACVRARWGQPRSTQGSMMAKTSTPQKKPAANARAPRSWILAAACLVVAGVGAGCGGSSPPGTGSSQAVKPPPGCNQYCQTAGGPGGPLSGKRMSTILTSRTVHRLADGTVPVMLTCRYGGQCRGAIFLDLTSSEPCASRTNLHGNGGIGRADVLLGSNTTRSFRVPLSGCGAQLLRDKGPLKLYVVANLGASFCPQLKDPTLAECDPDRRASRGRWEYFAYTTLVVKERP
jgi:hypothetical protein